MTATLPVVDYSGLFTSSSSGFTPIQFDPTLLAAGYSAKLAMSSANSTPQATPQSSSNHGPAVIPPWQNQPTQTLTQKELAVNGVTNFIDLNSAMVKSAGNNKDSTALFALYGALSQLQTIATEAADPNTAAGLLSKLNAQFQTGMAQVQGYIQTADLSKLTLMLGAKQSMLTSTATLGKDSGTVTGNTVMTGMQGGVVPGLTGTEKFTLKVGTDSFSIDLSQISQPLSLGNIAAYMNQKVAALPRLDANGNVMLDASGNQLSKYSTQFQVVPQGSGFALQINGSTTEPVSFTAAVSDPSLYITGNYTPADGSTSTGMLMQVAGLSTTTPTTVFREAVAGQGPAPLALPSATAAKGTLSASNNALSAAAGGSSASAVVAAITAASTSAISSAISGGTGASTAAATSTVAQTSANATVTDSQGNVYVVGQTKGNEGNVVNGSANGDVYLTKYDSTGKAVWNRLVGASTSAAGYGITVDGQDNVIISGQSTDALNGGTHLFNSNQAFVAKYDSQGTQAWIQQFDSLPSTSGLAVTVDAGNNVIVGGQVNGQLNSSTTYGGGQDAFVAQLDSATGTVLKTTQYGGTGDQSVTSVAVAADGNFIVAGNENGHAVVHKLSSTDLSTMYSVDLGALSSGSVSAVKVSGNSIYVAGSTGNPALAGTIAAPAQGGSDGFVTMINDAGASGTAAWTSYLGTSGTDQVTGLQVSGGNVYVVGSTNSALAGQQQSGSTDAIAAKIDGTTGAQVWAKQLGGVLGSTTPTGVAFSATGYSVLSQLGLPTGTIQTTQQRDIQTQTSARPGEYFYISINGGAKNKITIQAGDTFQNIATRINMLSLANISASQAYSSNGPTLQIKPLNDASFQIFSGDGGLNALPHLGLEPTKILSANALYGVNTSSHTSSGTMSSSMAAAQATAQQLGGAFALGLQANYNVLDKTTAAYVASQLTAAIGVLGQAFRSLTYDPIKAQLLQQANAASGTVPTEIQNQLASYTYALQRLQAMNGTGTSA
jgi:hypothetical protein